MHPLDSRLERQSTIPLSKVLMGVVSLIAPLLLTGCLVIPIPTGDKVVMSGKRVSADTMDRIEVGVTTRQQVLELLGSPILDWEDERILAYQWDVRKMLILWMLAGGNTLLEGSCEVPRHHVLLIQFGPDGRVRRVGRTVRAGVEHVGDHLVEWWNAEGVKSGEKLLQPDSSKLPQVRVVFRAIGRVQGQSIAEASGGKIRTWCPLFSGRTLYPGWGTLHSGGAPVYVRPKPLPGEAGKAGWFEMILRAENNYLFLGPSLETRNVMPPSARTFNVVYRLDLPPDSPVVYAGSLYLECVYSKRYLRSSRPHVSSLVKSACEVRAEPEALSAALAASGINPQSVVTHLMRPHEGVPVLRTPVGSRTRVRGH